MVGGWGGPEDGAVRGGEEDGFTGEDDLENLHMGFMSFCENKVSKIIVWEYMVYVIIKYREPRFQVMQNEMLHMYAHAFPATHQAVRVQQAPLKKPKHYVGLNLSIFKFESIRIWSQSYCNMEVNVKKP